MTRHELNQPTVRRRTVLQAIAGTAVAGSVLSGCGGSDSASRNTNEVNKKVKMPTYRQYRGVKPDLVGKPEIGLDDAYLKFPARHPRTISQKPGHGGSVSALVINYGPTPTPLSRNKFWQSLNDRLGTSLQITPIPSTDFDSKFATTIAGGDLPDFLQVIDQPQDLPQLLAAKCQDLTEYLSGDAVNDYPFLANMPTEQWRQCVYNGAIYGIPIPGARMGSFVYRRDDLIGKMGVDPNPTSFAEFEKLCQELTRTRENSWALSSPPLEFVQQMLGVPCKWKNDGGKLTNINELPETKQALDAVSKLMKAGYVHPDALAQNDNNLNLMTWFNAGSALMHYDSYNSWGALYQLNVAGPSYHISGLMPPAFDASSKAVTWQGTLVNSMTALKKTSDKDRVKELLGIANWLTAPFGTDEYLFLQYGLAGHDYTMQKGLPVKTDSGKAEILPLGYIAQCPRVLFFGEYTTATRDAYEMEKKFLPISVGDPTQGLYSNTYSRQGEQLDKQLTDAQNAIMQGHKPLSSWDDAVKAWRSGGGDKIRHEYEQALQNR